MTGNELNTLKETLVMINHDLKTMEQSKRNYTMILKMLNLLSITLTLVFIQE